MPGREPDTARHGARSHAARGPVPNVEPLPYARAGAARAVHELGRVSATTARPAAAPRPRPRVRVGVSGWSYRAWRGPFYPVDLPAGSELAHAAQIFDTLEVNRSFYSLLTPSVYAQWYAQTPASTVFALKGGQFITHSKRLRDVRGPLANFFASGPLALRDKLGPIVWQLPRNFHFDAARLADFLALLPKRTSDAARLGREHDRRVRDAYLEVHHDRPLRHVLEARHPSFATPELSALLRRAGVALAVSESPDWPCFEEVTADFMYLRLHGSERTYQSRYDDRQLARWAARILAWHRGDEPRDARRISEPARPTRRRRDVYVYFDNDAHAHAPADARRLQALLAGAPKRAR
jgi:uncharacterized protein YecE (DUF72 family)